MSYAVRTDVLGSRIEPAYGETLKVNYLRERWKWMVGGFLVGLAAGYARGFVFESPDLTWPQRHFLAAQIAFAFIALALFISNYLELRKRVIKKAAESREG